jgi:hypothetical protein
MTSNSGDSLREIIRSPAFGARNCPLPPRLPRRLPDAPARTVGRPRLEVLRTRALQHALFLLAVF